MAPSTDPNMKFVKEAFEFTWDRLTNALKVEEMFPWAWDQAQDALKMETVVYTIRSDKDTHFTGAIAQNAKEDENLTGLARLIRGYSVSALENIPLWHERDISHSSVERVIGPDATILMDFMLDRCTGLIANLVVYPENMMRNLNLMRGLVFSQRVLLGMAGKGVSRERAYTLVQRNAMKVWEEGKDFQAELIADADVREHLSEEEIREAFDMNYHLKHVDTIFTRVFGG